jgi:hypothetical protein
MAPFAAASERTHLQQQRCWSPSILFLFKCWSPSILVEFVEFACRALLPLSAAAGGLGIWGLNSPCRALLPHSAAAGGAGPRNKTVRISPRSDHPKRMYMTMLAKHDTNLMQIRLFRSNSDATRKERKRLIPCTALDIRFPPRSRPWSAVGADALISPSKSTMDPPSLSPTTPPFARADIWARV